MSETAQNASLPPELPPVEAPTAGFIIQLFVIPALIVGVVVVVWLLFGKLAGGERDARSYVEKLKGDSADWRAAYELANLIQNDSNLAQDGELLGELTALLDQELRTEANPKFDQFLALTLGGFKTLDAKPVGGKPVDTLATLASALDAKHASPIRIAAAASLAKHGARLDGKLESEVAVKALAESCQASEPEVRQISAYALGFLGGEAASATLRGRLNDEDRYVRYNAAIALGRQGDPMAVSVFREILSPQAMAQVIKFETKTETDNKIEEIELEGLESLQTSIRVGHATLAKLLRPEIEALSKGGQSGVRTRANELLQQLPASE